MNKNKKEYFLTLQRGAYGFFVCEYFCITDNNDEIVDMGLDRVKSTYEQYQFKTEYEAIKDFENWCGDNWDGVERRW